MSNQINVVGWEANAQDSYGKTLTEVFYVLIGGKERALGRQDLIKQIKLATPERGQEEPQERTPTFPAMAEGNGR